MQIASLVEFHFTTPLRVATLEGVTDENGLVYTKHLPSHPGYQISLPERYFGVFEVADISITLENVDAPTFAVFNTLFRAAEARGTRLTLRRKRLDTGTVLIRSVAKIQSVSFGSDATITVAAADMATDLLNADYPGQRLDTSLVGSVLTENQSVEQAVPVIVGAVREHTPCLYAEERDSDSYYRYIVCLDLWPLYALSEGTFPPLIRPYINSLYRGAGDGVSYIDPGEYEQEWVANSPTLTTAGFRDFAQVLVGDGSLTGDPWYLCVAYNRFGIVATSPTRTTTFLADVSRTLGWSPVHNASFYRLFRADGFGFQVLATIAPTDYLAIQNEGTGPPLTVAQQALKATRPIGIAATSLWWKDSGTVTPSASVLPPPSFIPPTWDKTIAYAPPNFVSAIFNYRQYQNDQPVPILADVETTEMGPTLATKGLWLFRGDMRTLASGAIPQTNLAFRTSRFLHEWRFKGAFAGDAFCVDSVGALALAHNGLTAANLRAGRHFGEQVLTLKRSDLHPGESHTGTVEPYAAEYDRHPYLERADSLDLEIYADTSLYCEIECRAEANTSALVMTLCGKGGVTGPGWLFQIYKGAPRLTLVERGSNQEYICEGVTGPDPTNPDPNAALNGQWATVGFEVDRINGLARVFVNRVVQGTRDISTLSSCETSSLAVPGIGQLLGTFRIGNEDDRDQNFEGDIDRVTFLTGAGSPWAFAHGKANSGINALNCAAMWEAPWIDQIRAATLRLGGSNAFFTVWALPDAIQGGEGGVVLSHCDGTNGLDIAFRAAGSGTVNAHLHIAGTKYEVNSLTTFRVKQPNCVSILIDRNNAFFQIFLNGVAGERITIEAGAINSTAPFIVGALNLAQGCRFDGRVDEVHIELDLPLTGRGSRGLLEHRHIYYMGMRNAIRQWRTLLGLHDVNAPLDVGTWVAATNTFTPGSWDDAEDDFAAVVDDASMPCALKADYAMVEVQSLRLHGNELLRLRGGRMGFAADGQWTCNVDTQPSVMAATFRWGSPNSNLAARPTWNQGTLRDLIQKLRGRYRRTRGASGEVRAYLEKTATRTVLTIGNPTIQSLEFPAIRDAKTADIVTDYTAKWLKLLDSECTVAAEIEELFVIPGPGGALVTVLDPTTGVPEGEAISTRVVATLTESGQTGSLVTVDWDAVIYSYTPATATLDPQLEVVETELAVLPEDQPDYSNTDPPPVSLVTVYFDQDHIAVVSWTPPDSPNYLEAVVKWRRKPRTLVSGGVLAGLSLVVAGASGLNVNVLLVTGIPLTLAPNANLEPSLLEFVVVSRNRAGLEGIAVTVDKDNTDLD